MKIVELVEELGKLGKSPLEKQTYVSIIEASNIWNAITSRYDALSITNVYSSLIKDDELKMIVNEGQDVLNGQVHELEQAMKEYAIPAPEKPPENIQIPIDFNLLSDKAIYRTIHKGLADSCRSHTTYATSCSSSTLRRMFTNFLTQEVDLHDKFTEYGKIKGYLNEVPSHRVE